MTNKRVFFVLISVVCFAFLLGTSGTELLAQTYTIKCGMVGPPEDEDYQGGLVFKNYVETQSKGKIKVELYPAGQLGNFREMLESVSVGTQEIAITTVGGISNMFPEIQVTDIPYLFPDDRVIEKVHDGWFTDKLRDAVLQKLPNIRLMAASNGGGWRCFMNKSKQVRTPADLKGMKLRIIESELHVNFMKIMGASGTPVPAPEMYTALKTGIVDGLNIGVPDMISYKLHEILRHVTLDYHMYLGTFYWINNPLYKSLSDDLKKIVQDGLYHMKWYCRDYNKRLAVDAFDIFKKIGGTVYLPTPEEKEQFVQATKPVRQWFIDKYGKEWMDTLEKAVSEASKELENEHKKNM